MADGGIPPKAEKSLGGFGMNASEIMSPTVGVEVSDTVFAAAKMMRDSGASFLVAMRDGEVAGVISESDMVLGCVASGHVPSRCAVERHMAAQKQTASPDTHVADASITIIDGALDCLPVLDGGELSGLLTSGDVFDVIDGEMAYSTA